MSIPPRPPPPTFLADSLCFSSASILRCSPLNQVENAVLIIPTALEVIFTTSLIFIVKDGGWIIRPTRSRRLSVDPASGPLMHHLFLTIESWFYLVLAILEVLSHVLPAARASVPITRGFDLAIGILAPLPLLLYISFLYLFARQEFLYSLPRRFQRVLNLMLPIFIPVITAVNAVASFVGVNIRPDPRTANLPLIGFPTPRDSTLWSFFTSLTLAILTLYQAIVFLIALHRLLSILVSQRRIENSSQDAIHLVKGVGWINIAIKLGAVESVLGFVGGSFGLFMVRRILRFAARVAWCLGIARGVDELEDFRAIQREMTRSASRRQPNGNLRTLISNPRLSTFREMSPSAAMFHSTLRQARPGETDPSLNQFSRLRNELYTGEMANVPGQRVTVSYDSPKGAPTLHMRLSSVQLPDPVKLAESIKARSRRSTQPIWGHGIQGSQSSMSGFVRLEQGRDRMSSLQSSEKGREYANTEKASPTEKIREKSWISQWTEAEKRSSYFPPSFQQRNSLFVPQKEERNSSSQISSIYTPSVSDPPQIVSALRRTVSQTPARGVIIPTSAVASSVLDVFVTAPSMYHASGISSTTEDTSRSPDTVDLLRELTPQFPSTPLNEDDIPPPSAASSEGFTPRLTAEDKGKTPIRGGLPSPPSSNSSTPRLAISRPLPLRPMPSPKRYSASASPLQHQASPKRQSNGSPGIVDFGMALSQPKIREWRRDSRIPAIRPNSASRGLATHIEDEDVQNTNSTMTNPFTGKTTIASTEGLAVPWLHNPDYLDEDDLRRRVRADSSTSSIAYPMRVKSFGNAPRKATPVPIRTRVAKRSTHLEPLIIPPVPHAGKTEIIQEFNGSEVEDGVRRDSEVLGMEGIRARQMRDVRAYYNK